MAEPPFDELFAISPAIRYVAFAEGQEVAMREREGIEGASSSDADRFEELLVNPALLTLARQRGEIDCGAWLSRRRARASPASGCATGVRGVRRARLRGPRSAP